MLAHSLGRALRRTTHQRGVAGVGGLAFSSDSGSAGPERPPLATPRTFSIIPERFSSSAGTSRSASGIALMESALGLATEHALVSRLARVFDMPGECLMAQVASVRSLLLHPCDLSTTAHALWVLVRCPELRTCSEAQLRGSVRRLQQTVAHLELDRSTLLAAVYKRPWMLAAMLQPPHAAAAAAGALAQPSSWRQELAAFLLEMRHSSSNGSSGDGSSGGSIVGAAPGAVRAARGIGGSGGAAASPLLQSTMLPLAAVKAYLAFKEAGAAARAVLSGTATRPHKLPQAASSGRGGNAPAAAHAAPPGVAASSQLRCEPHSLSSNQSEALAEAAATPTAAPATAAAGSSSSCGDGGSVRYDQLLQSVLAFSYPQAVQLPPELLLSRCQLLGSGLQGGRTAAVDAVESLVMSCPYLLLSPAEVHSVGGGGKPQVVSSDFL